MSKIKKIKIRFSKIKTLLLLLILFIGFSTTSPKTRMLLANHLEASAWLLYETIDHNNKNKWYVENRFISFIRIKLKELSKKSSTTY